MAYLNSRGYVIPKSSLSSEELESLKQDLTLSPKTNHAIKSIYMPEKKIVVYRENESKIYIPRVYGINKYGIPEKNEISNGDDIHVPFANELRDYQTEIVSIYLNHVRDNSSGGILDIPC